MYRCEGCRCRDARACARRSIVHHALTRVGCCGIIGAASANRTKSRAGGQLADGGAAMSGPKNVLLLALFVALTALALACSAPTPVPSSQSAPGAPQPTAPASQLELPTGQMIVRTGDTTSLVEDAVQALDDVGRLAVENEGYLVSSSVEGGEGGNRASASFRVPSANFDSAMAALRRMAARVLSESTRSQDVTEEYVDLQSRLRNLEASETQLLSFMTRAETVR